MYYLQLNKITAAIILCDVIGVIATLIYNDTLIMDMWEHLRATSLIILGNVPYQDFFEHHHPLLWYTFAPIMQILPQNAIIIFYAARVFAMLCSAGTIYFIYKIIINFLGKKDSFIPFLLILFTFFPVWYNLSLFKPEVVAYLLYFMGLYFCFDYIKNFQLRSLIVCGIANVAAFLFIQTMIFNIIFVGIALVAVCYKRHGFVMHLIYAVTVPTIVLASMAILLNRFNMWDTYLQLNWLYNVQIHIDSSLAIWNWSLPILIAFVSLFYLIYKADTPYFKIIGFLLACEIILIFYFHKSFPHYLFLIFVYVSMLIGCYLQKIQRPFLKMPFYIYLICSLLINSLTILIKNNQMIMDDYKTINQSAQNTVLNIYPSASVIYGKEHSYYEMFSVDMIATDICTFNRFPNYNLETEIQNNQYTYLIYDDTKDYLKTLCSKERFRITENTLKHYNRISRNLWKHK